MLKHLLVNILALAPLCMSQMSIQTIAMSDFGETLITLGLDAREMLSKMWFCFKIISISLEESLGVHMGEKWNTYDLQIQLRLRKMRFLHLEGVDVIRALDVVVNDG